ncbi:MAG: choice-of-anchor J domain-containing protein, partial [Anaerolineae bacterium]
MENRFARVALFITVAAFALVGLSAVTAHSAAADFGCFGDLEDFEGSFPPSGWQAIDDWGGSPVIWHRSDDPPYYGVGNYPPMSGYYAYAESYPEYCGDSYDTWLVTPEFSTEGMREVLAEFDYQYWYYNGDKLDFDYSLDGGNTWTTAQNMASNGGYVASHSSIDISEVRGEPSVKLRWRYYNVGGCDWWTGVDNVEMVCQVDAAAVDALPVTFADPEKACVTGLAEIKIDVVNTGTGPLNDVSGQPEFMVSLRASNGAPISVTGISSRSVGPGQIPGAAPLGGTATADLQLGVGESDVVTIQVGFPVGLGNTGDLIIDRAVWVDVTPQNGEVDPGELYEFLGDEEPFPIPCEPTVDPNRQLGMQVHLPILNYIGNDDRCNTWIEVQ